MRLKLMALVMIVACASSSGVRVKSDRNPDADFGRYATYAWARAPLGGGVWPARNDRTAFDWKVRELVDAEMTRKGYAQGAPGQSDLLVDYRVSVQERELSDTFGEYARYRSAGGDQGLGEAFVQGYEEGTLVVEVSDAATRRLLWFGSASAVVNPSLRNQRMPDAMRRVFETFPPRASR